jgi:hypothetical protein
MHDQKIGVRFPVQMLRFSLLHSVQTFTFTLKLAQTCTVNSSQISDAILLLLVLEWTSCVSVEFTRVLLNVHAESPM